MLTRPPYAFSFSSTDAYSVVHAAGELDIAAVADMLDAVRAAGRHAGQVVVDLRDVSFLDSFALQALITLQRAKGDGPSLQVVPGPGIQRVLDLTGTRAALRWISPEQLGV